MDNPSTIIIPVESQVRELDAKLLLAAVAAERGFPTVLGSRPFVSFALPSLPRGVFFAKSMRFTSDLMTRFILAFGHHMVASDEESLVRFDHPDYYTWRFSEHSFTALRHLFAWGRDDAEMFRNYPGRGDVRIHETGNPRADLLLPEVRRIFDADVAELRRRHGSFILVNTTFPFVNNFVDSLNLLRRSSAGEVEVSRTGRGMSMDFAGRMERHHHALFKAFSDLLPALSKAFPGRTIVLRPHPSENHDVWKQLTEPLSNVRVVHEGNVVPWLMAAEVLVHNGCTTAVEGALLGTPAVTYRPVVSADHDYQLPNSLSVEAATPDDALDAIADVLNGRSEGVSGPRQRKILERHVVSAGQQLAAERIIDVLEREGYLVEVPTAPSMSSIAYGWLGTHLRTSVKRINLRRRGHRNSREYLRHRFPPLNSEAVNRRLGSMGRVLDRFDGIEATSIGEDLFSVARR